MSSPKGPPRRIILDSNDEASSSASDDNSRPRKRPHIAEQDRSRQTHNGSPRPQHRSRGDRARDLAIQEAIDLTDDADYEAHPHSPATNVMVITDEDLDEDSPATSDLIKDQAPKVPKDRGALRDTICIICMEAPETVAVTPCGHIYCSNCVFRALSSTGRATEKRGECSICRKKVAYSRVVFLEMRLAPTTSNKADSDSSDTKVKGTKKDTKKTGDGRTRPGQANRRTSIATTAATAPSITPDPLDMPA